MNNLNKHILNMKNYVVKACRNNNVNVSIQISEEMGQTKHAHTENRMFNQSL